MLLGSLVRLARACRLGLKIQTGHCGSKKNEKVEPEAHLRKPGIGTGVKIARDGEKGESTSLAAAVSSMHPVNFMEIGFEYSFYPDMVDGADQPELISGNTPSQFGRSESLVLKRRTETRTFRIAFEYHSSAPFTQVLVIDELLAVGHKGYFYLYDMRERKCLQALSLRGYFGHMYSDGDGFFVADADSLYHVSKNGSIIWHSVDLGIDGVIVDAFSPTTISGHGEWDPPGGWKPFMVDRKTGKRC